MSTWMEMLISQISHRSSLFCNRAISKPRQIVIATRLSTSQISQHSSPSCKGSNPAHKADITRRRNTSPKRHRKLHEYSQTVRCTGFSRRTTIPPKGGTTNGANRLMQFPSKPVYFRWRGDTLAGASVLNLSKSLPPKCYETQ